VKSVKEIMCWRRDGDEKLLVRTKLL